MDIDKYKPRLNPWYVGSGQYRGEATLTVSNGKVYNGDAVIDWNDTGRAEVTVELDSDFPLAGHEIMEAQSVAVKVVGADGSFTANRAIAFNANLSVGVNSAPPTVKLAATESEYTLNETDAAVYWVAPLINFISRFRHRSAETDNHPIRIFSTPVVGGDVAEQERARALLTANSKNSLILFNFSGHPGFIEPLPDYTERAKGIESGDQGQVATAVMVGSIPEGARLDPSGVRTWFPSAYLYAVSVASGSFVGFPFIELRSDKGTLTKRILMSSSAPKYERGTKIIDEMFINASGSPTGVLMDQMQAALSARQHLCSVANYVVASGLQSSVIENYADNLVRAFEALVTAEGVATQNLLDGVPSTSQEVVRIAIDNAATVIRAEMTKLMESGEVDAANRLSRIADRARSACQKEAMFGLAVAALLRKYDLKDEAVLNAVLASRTPPTTWAQMLSKIRGAVIHTGYIDLPSRADLLSQYAFLRHLHDVLVRLFLIQVGYKGTYQPVVAEFAGTSKELNWVEESTPPTKLRLS